MTYKAIGFDWGGVLNGKPGGVFGKAIATMLDITLDEYRTAYFHHNTEFNNGQIDGDELWRRILAELGKQERLTQVLDFVAESFKDNPNEDVIALVDRLRDNGYKVGLLSNNTKEMGERIRKSGLDKHFDVFHISAETGHSKPSPESFTHFTDALSIAPEELLFIDDTEKSLSAAANVGFTPILFTDYEQLLADLRSFDVSI